MRDEATPILAVDRHPHRDPLVVNDVGGGCCHTPRFVVEPQADGSAIAWHTCACGRDVRPAQRVNAALQAFFGAVGLHIQISCLGLLQRNYRDACERLAEEEVSTP